MLNRENFEKLSTYLRKLPPDYEDFDMHVYGNIAAPPGTKYTCGSVGCALGHGFAAGVGEPSGYFTTGGWMRYCLNSFSDEQVVYSWCFADAWAVFNNTPKGAAERIDYMLDHGVPEEVVGHHDFFDYTEEVGGQYDFFDHTEDDGDCPAKDWATKLDGYKRGGPM